MPEREAGEFRSGMVAVIAVVNGGLGFFAQAQEAGRIIIENVALLSRGQERRLLDGFDAPQQGYAAACEHPRIGAEAERVRAAVEAAQLGR